MKRNVWVTVLVVAAVVVLAVLCPARTEFTGCTLLEEGVRCRAVCEEQVIPWIWGGETVVSHIEPLGDCDGGTACHIRVYSCGQ